MQKQSVDLPFAAGFRVSFRYVLVLSILAALALVSYFILEENIRANKGSAAIINVSGRQRMLSQRIAFFSLEFVRAKNSHKRQECAKGLKEAIVLMGKSHNALLHGEINVPFVKKLIPSTTRALYLSMPLTLDSQVRRYLNEARKLLNAAEYNLTLDNPHLAYILEAARGELLASLDMVVRLYQAESEKRIIWVELLELLILAITLFTLLATGLFIFRPMARRIVQESKELEKQDALLLQANQKLQKEINERTDLARQLAFINEFDEALLRTIPFGIDIVDREGAILYLNEKMQNVFGKDALGKRCYLLYKDDKSQCLNCPLRKGLEFGEVKEIEVSGVLGAKTFLITHTAMTYQGKEAVLEIFEDISEYKHTQEQLALSERLAGIGRMAGVIAHEFRNQLGVIRNAAYFLKIKIQDPDEKIQRHLAILDEQVNETERIIENILTFSRTKQPRLQKINLEKLLRAALAKIVVPQSIEIITRMEALPLIEADPVQLHTVFVNIILNAIEAMGEKGKLSIELTKQDTYATIIFKDTGVGIKEEEKKRIFEPFFSTKVQGTGLGLATAKVIVQGHKGNITLESEYGKGTAIMVSLPLR